MTFFTSEEERDMLLFTSRNEIRAQVTRTRMVVGAVTDTTLGLSAVGVCAFMAWHGRPWWQIAISGVMGIIAIVLAGTSRVVAATAFEESLTEPEKKNEKTDDKADGA